MITVLLCEVHPLIRNALRSVLKDCAGVAVVGEASNGREAVAYVTELKPDVVVLDVSMPRLDGPETTTTIKHENMARDGALRRFHAAMTSGGRVLLKKDL